MLSQVSGRAGRKGDQQGLVILQTSQPDSPVIQQVVRHDYRAFYDQLFEERRLFRYPPFTHLTYIYLKHRQERTVDVSLHGDGLPSSPDLWRPRARARQALRGPGEDPPYPQVDAQTRVGHRPATRAPVSATRCSRRCYGPRPTGACRSQLCMLIRYKRSVACRLSAEKCLPLQRHKIGTR